MKPVKFHPNCINYAEGQPEYETLPVLRANTPEGIDVCISCWEFSFIERIKVLFFGKIYLSVLGLQPPVSLDITKIVETTNDGPQTD